MCSLTFSFNGMVRQKIYRVGSLSLHMDDFYPNNIAVQQNNNHSIEPNKNESNLFTYPPPHVKPS